MGNTPFDAWYECLQGIRKRVERLSQKSWHHDDIKYHVNSNERQTSTRQTLKQVLVIRVRETEPVHYVNNVQRHISAISKWSAKSFQGRLSDFGKFVFKYLFFNLAVFEVGVPPSSRLSL